MAIDTKPKRPLDAVKRRVVECPLSVEAQQAAVWAGVKATSVLGGYPFAVARTRMYTGTSDTVTRAIAQIIREEGTLGLYKRGFWATCLKMGAKEGYRGHVYETWEHGLASAFINALLDTGLTAPLDRAQVLQQDSKTPLTTLQAIMQMRNGRGFLTGAYRGGTTYFARQFFAHGATVGTQNLVDEALKKYYGDRNVPVAAGVAGATVAGLAVATFTNPINMAIAMMQSGKSNSRNPMGILLAIAQAEGMGGVLKGSAVSYGFAIYGQLCYHGSKRWCEGIRGRDGSPGTQAR